MTQFVPGKVSKKDSECEALTAILLRFPMCSGHVMATERFGVLCAYHLLLCVQPRYVFSNEGKSASLVAYYQATKLSKQIVRLRNSRRMFLSNFLLKTDLNDVKIMKQNSFICSMLSNLLLREVRTVWNQWNLKKTCLDSKTVYLTLKLN